MDESTIPAMLANEQILTKIKSIKQTKIKFSQATDDFTTDCIVV